MAGDGQVSMGPTVVKPNARKIRRLGDNIIVGFAGHLPILLSFAISENSGYL